MSATGTTDVGGRGPPGALSRRLLRHYLPLAAGTLAVLASLVSVPFLDANRYPPPDDTFAEGVAGAFPDGEYPPTRSDAGHFRSMAGTTTSGSHTGPPAGDSTGETNSGAHARCRRLPMIWGNSVSDVATDLPQIP